jgi:hypothetical protein
MPKLKQFPSDRRRAGVVRPSGRGTGNEGEESSEGGQEEEAEGEATSMKLKHILVVLGAALFLAACSTVESPRSSSNSPTMRCGEGPGRGQSLSDTRPLFFLFCTQAP